MVRPRALVVQRARSGQRSQFVSSWALPFAVMVAVTPAGHVSVVPTWWKSSMVNPPGTAGCNGPGLITARNLRRRRCARNSPEP